MTTSTSNVSSDAPKSANKAAVIPGVGGFYKHKLSEKVVQVEFLENFKTVFFHDPGSSKQDTMGLEEFAYTYEVTDDPNKEAVDNAQKDAERIAKANQKDDTVPVENDNHAGVKLEAA